ncbi:hypothetical protein [Photorhabdus australis]|uniref:hypothetical protein n=1 Tax=Photorhabdus australis TaxID=286156 RepID=UPI00056A0CA8|nr:hypothetical protein [Photorhabdus australis]
MVTPGLLKYTRQNKSVNEISKQVADIQNLAKKGMMNGTPIRAKDISKGRAKIGNQRTLEMWNKILGVNNEKRK